MDGKRKAPITAPDNAKAQRIESFAHTAYMQALGQTHARRAGTPEPVIKEPHPTRHSELLHDVDFFARLGIPGMDRTRIPPELLQPLRTLGGSWGERTLGWGPYYPEHGTTRPRSPPPHGHTRSGLGYSGFFSQEKPDKSD